MASPVEATPPRQPPGRWRYKGVCFLQLCSLLCWLRPPAFTDKQVVLAFLKDGKPLDDKEGPYRIVIPDEKRMARWVRQVTTLKIVDVQ